MNTKSTRDHIVEAADKLFYHQGFEATSFADIADAVKISRGNFYYHFKSKDEILNAVIDLRIENTRKMLEKWEREGSTPLERIETFIRINLRNKNKIMKYGCPVGSLCTELAKIRHASQAEANKLYELFRGWLTSQFEQLGCSRQSEQFSLHLLARSLGVAALTHVFKDDTFVNNEVEQMCEWVRQSVADCSQVE